MAKSPQPMLNKFFFNWCYPKRSRISSFRTRSILVWQSNLLFWSFFYQEVMQLLSLLPLQSIYYYLIILGPVVNVPRMRSTRNSRMIAYQTPIIYWTGLCWSRYPFDWLVEMEVWNRECCHRSLWRARRGGHVSAVKWLLSCLFLLC
jgi:hypothetical protein